MAVQTSIDIGDERDVPGFLEVRGGANFARRQAAELYFFFTRVLPDYKTPSTEYVARLMWQEIKRDFSAWPDFDPTLRLNDELAADLSQILWRAGVRAKDAEGSTGQITAMQAHIKNLQEFLQSRSSDFHDLEVTFGSALNVMDRHISDLRRQLEHREKSEDSLAGIRIIARELEDARKQITALSLQLEGREEGARAREATACLKAIEQWQPEAKRSADFRAGMEMAATILRARVATHFSGTEDS